MSEPAPAAGGLPAGDGGRGTTERRSRGPLRSSTVSGLVLYALVFALALTPVPYLLQTPGPVVNTLEPYKGEDLVTITGTETHEADGTLDMLTVAVAGGPGRDIFAAQTVLSLVNGVETVVPSEAFYPLTATRDDVANVNSADMISSQDQATAAALTELGIDFDTVIGVSDVAADSPAEGVIEPGDHVLAVDGQDVAGTPEGMAEVRDAVVSSSGPLTLRIDRGGGAQDVEVEPASVDGTPTLGIVMSAAYRFPFDVEFAVEGIGGPSAGTIFALTIIDMLTEGNLTGGQAIAGTGAIDASGTVSPIGGARQKVAAAAASGADWFLSPADNCAEVLSARGADQLTVVRIDDLSAAHSAVKDIAAGSTNDLPTCTDASR